METPVLSAASICNCKSATEIYIILPQDKSKFTCRIRISNSCISLDWSFKWLLADVRALKKKDPFLMVATSDGCRCRNLYCIVSGKKKSHDVDGVNRIV